MGKQVDMSVFIIPVLSSSPITVFVIIWSIALTIFLLTCVGLFTVGIRPCWKGIIKQCTHLHSPQPTPFTPSTTSHPEYFPIHPSPSKIMPHSPPPTTKIFSEPLSPTQNNAPKTPNHPKNSSSHLHSPKIWFNKQTSFDHLLKTPHLASHMTLWLWG